MSASAVHDARRPSPWSDPRLVVPSAEAWEAMSEAERAREEERILAVLDEYREIMSEDAYQDRLEEAERRRQEAERLQQDTENRRQEAEHRRQEAERLQGVTALRLESARRGLAAMILRRLQEQGLAPTDAQKAQITSCEDVTELLRWVDKASSATTVEDLLAQQ